MDQNKDVFKEAVDAMEKKMEFLDKIREKEMMDEAISTEMGKDEEVWIDPSPTKEVDNVNHPSHYTAYRGIEVIDLTEQMNFNKGNAVKYICRAGLKNPETELEDLHKARWYIDREINRVLGEKSL